MRNKALVINCEDIAGRIHDNVCTQIVQLKKKGIELNIAIILACDSPTARLYVERQCRQFKKAGMGSFIREILDSPSEEKIRRTVEEFNNDPSVTGIVLSLPLPEGVNIRSLQSTILPGKDVEGVHPQSPLFSGRRNL